MADSPISDKSIYISFSVKVDGSDIDDTFQVKEIDVSKAVNRIPKAQIVIYDGSASKSDFEISNTETFVPGKEIEISAGYESGSNTLFKGIITKHELQLRAGKSFLVIECRDKAFKMTSGRKNGFFAKMKDSDIISKLIGDYGLITDVDSTTQVHNELVQYYVSDWDFTLIRAEVNGLLVYVSDGKLSVKKPDFSSSPQLKLTYGIDIIDFNAVMNAEDTLQEVTGYSWSPEKLKVTSAKGDQPGSPEQGNIAVKTLSEVVAPSEYRLQTSGFLENEVLKQWATSKRQKTGLSAYRCRFKFQGSEKAIVGSMIEISGMGKRFDGNAFITSVHHTIKGGDWITEIETGMSADFFSEEVMNIESPPAAGLNSSVQGLHHGIVKKIHEDPNNQTRILLEVPMMENTENGIWARLANLYASESFGTFFLPEIGDEVLVGFINNDPGFPVILGSLYSSKKAAPYQPDQENTFKAIVTKSKLKIEFEDVKKIITIITPNENRICFDDDKGEITIEDENKNSAIFSDEGITFKSPKKITLDAKGDIEITTNGNLKMDAKSNVNISGMEISNDAKTNYKASGTASAELSTAGQCTVKGAMVMIN